MGFSCVMDQLVFIRHTIVNYLSKQAGVNWATAQTFLHNFLRSYTLSRLFSILLLGISFQIYWTVYFTCTLLEFIFSVDVVGRCLKTSIQKHFLCISKNGPIRHTIVSYLSKQESIRWQHDHSCSNIQKCPLCISYTAWLNFSEH